MRLAAHGWAGLLGLVALVGCGSSSPSAPSDVSTPPSRVPTLLAPAEAGTLGNDCSGETWSFDWSDVVDAARYHLQVRSPGDAGGLVIDVDGVAQSSYVWARPDAIGEENRRGWRWRVQAFVGGAWAEWSPERTFDVDRLVPVLQTPVPGAVLDNGCSSGSNGIQWDFDWSDCRGAVSYHVHVKHPNAAIAVIDEPNATSSAYTYLSRAWIGEGFRRGWQWRVRARRDGGWTEWSPEREFDVEPLDADCVPASR